MSEPNTDNTEKELPSQKLDEENELEFEFTAECMPGSANADDLSKLRFSIQKISALFYKASFNLAIRLYQNRPVEEANKLSEEKAELSLKESEIVSLVVTSCIDTYGTVHGRERFNYHRKMQMCVPSVFRVMNEIKDGLKEFGDEEIEKHPSWNAVAKSLNRSAQRSARDKSMRARCPIAIRRLSKQRRRGAVERRRTADHEVIVRRLSTAPRRRCFDSRRIAIGHRARMLLSRAEL
ncbi:unnamed protein product [Caenorhabditis auriculariae]|uniref:Uncharacterized protein n=1 Tax=Caenorhabditis auriculariae TaxID=2777116 RepID=A0A8S1HUN8_9PELO|nr:unnamed protein product [Caenorhabditis auriculariae]